MQIRNLNDRRSSEGRRQTYDADCFQKVDRERRAVNRERRLNGELREGWVRVTDWSSIAIDLLR